METNKDIDIRYVYDDMQFRNHKREVRSFILNIILIALLVISNLAWLMYKMSFEDVYEVTTTQEVMQETLLGSNSFIGGDYDTTNCKDNY